MANKQPQTVTIDDREYNVEDLSQQQIVLINHLQDLDRKINSTTFQLDQLNVGRNAFMTLLKESLETEDGNDI